LLFSTNELPKETENTDGFFRRWLIVPFDVTIKEHEQDRELANKIIKTELSGVFNWVLTGLNRLLLQRRFTECKAAIEQVTSFRRQSDSVLMFLDEEGYKADKSHHRPLKELFEEYKAFSNNNGYRACSNRTFSERLRGAGYEVKRMSIGNAVYCIRSATM
jgi:putative DNA primase/helicase